MSNLDTAHEIWTTLSEIHEGTSTVKEAKLHRLRIKYEIFTMLPYENITKMYSRLNNIVNELNGLGTNLIDVDIVRKILRALPKKYEILVTLFLNSSKLPRMTPTGLLDNLITNELYKKDKEELMELSSSKKKITAFKAMAESSDKEEEEEDDSEEEFALLVRRMKRFMRRRPFQSANFDKKTKMAISPTTTNAIAIFVAMSAMRRGALLLIAQTRRMTRASHQRRKNSMVRRNFSRSFIKMARVKHVLESGTPMRSILTPTPIMRMGLQRREDLSALPSRKHGRFSPLLLASWQKETR